MAKFTHVVCLTAHLVMLNVSANVLETTKKISLNALVNLAVQPAVRVLSMSVPQLIMMSSF